MQKKMNLDSDLTSYTKINSKWILGLNGRPKTMKLPGQSIRENLCGLGLGKDIHVYYMKGAIHK